jgi:hypothetical protein
MKIGVDFGDNAQQACPYLAHITPFIRPRMVLELVLRLRHELLRIAPLPSINMLHERFFAPYQTRFKSRFNYGL